MTQRQIIQVDEAKCDGCGQCIPACPEGALKIIDGKARLARQSYCDGLGACLGDCPNGALSVLELDAEAYDEAGVIAHLHQTAPELLPVHMAHLQAHGMAASPAAVTCPSVQIQFRAPFAAQAPAGGQSPIGQPASSASPMASELRQWPVQLRLLPVRAPFFDNNVLTLVADCVPFASPNFHADVLRGSAVAVGCPKLDDAQAYVDKVSQILSANKIRALRVVYMEVPCCRGLVWIAEQALARSGLDIPFESVMVNIGI